ncbi:MAG: glycosyltransferase family 4 protein [Chryseolinea sp.]
MQQLLLATYVNFWEPGAGHKCRISTLVSYLQTKVSITLAFAGNINDAGRERISKRYPNMTVVALGDGRPRTFEYYKAQFEWFCSKHVFDMALIEYVDMSFVLPLLSADCTTFLDIHDLVHQRIDSFRGNNVSYDGLFLTREEEFQLFECYDYVLPIQEKEYATIVEQMHPERVILTPHAVCTPKVQSRDTLTEIGYIASAYAPNVDAITRFIDLVWSRLHSETGMFLNIYGPVCGSLRDSVKSHSSIRLHGELETVEQAYHDNDIMINPVRCGAGLKIKNIEAMGYGLPLITSSHGAAGIEDGQDHDIFSCRGH